MGFMQRDIDFKLIILILVVIIAIVGLTIFYQSSAGSIISKYDKVKEKLEDSQDNITTTTVQLDSCVKTLSNVSAELDHAQAYQYEAQDEFNELYQETENQLQSTESQLSNTENELEETNQELTDTETERDECIDTKANYEEAASNADNYAEDVQSTLDGCQGCSDVTECQACITTAMGDISIVRNYLEEIEG
jgi:chromosome segregation ATPase